MKSRLDKVLSNNGFGSRKDVKTMLKKHVCIIDGKRIINPSFTVDLNKTKITIDEKQIIIRNKVYLMINKPAGCVTSTSDPLHSTIMDYLREPFCNMKLFPIGRLDSDTEGLIIISNDGDITHKLTSPKQKIIKTYYLELLNDPSDEEIKIYTKKMNQGIVFKNGYKCKAAKFEECTNIKKHTARKKGFLIHITEGKYHQVKKMFLVVGNKISYLKRISMGPIILDENLSSGEYRELTNKEIKLLNQI